MSAYGAAAAADPVEPSAAKSSPTIPARLTSSGAQKKSLSGPPLYVIRVVLRSSEAFRWTSVVAGARVSRFAPLT